MFVKYAYLRWRRRRVQQFLAAARRARQVQQEVLLTKLRRNADSDFGREHGFAEIRSIADFRRRLPVADFEYDRPYIERVKRGELQSMFGAGTRLYMFALTSGTTNEPKYVPITKEFFEEYRSSWQLWGLQTYSDHLDLLRKQALQLSSDWRQSFTESGVPCGNISGLAAETAPRIAKSLFILPRDLIRIHNAASKHYTALRLALTSRRIGMIITANPSTLVEFGRLADSRRESLIRDIHDGTLSADLDIPQAVRQALRRLIVAHPARARELERCISDAGQLRLRDAWPDLSVLAVWTGGSVGVYLPQLTDHYGETALRDHGLSASEGRMTIPFQDGTSAGVLDFIHHYFEFIPAGERDQVDPPVLEAHELEVDKTYYILLSTSSGLYRYDIHDVVRCVGFEGEAPVLEFLNKGAHFSSITGEKLSEFQVVEAVKRSIAELGLPAGDFTLAPVMDDRPKYVLLVEPDLHANQSDALERRVDAHLSEINWEYAEKRRTGRLRPLRVCEVPTGTWGALRRQRAAKRGNFEEYKHRCLVGDVEFVEKLLGRPFSAKTSAPGTHRRKPTENT